MPAEKHPADIKILYENKERYLRSPSVARLAADRYLLMYHNAPARDPAVRHDPKSLLGTMTGGHPSAPDPKTKRTVPRFRCAGGAPSAARLSDSRAVITDNCYTIYNWMGEPNVPVIQGYNWVVLLRGGCSIIVDTSGEKLRFGKPRRITSIHYPAVACYDSPLTLGENTILCPVDYDTDCMHLDTRPWETIIMRTDDQGLTWRLHGVINAENEENKLPRMRYPSVRRLPDGRLVCAMLSQETEPFVYISESSDSGENWSAPQPAGFPAMYHSLISLADGRLMMTYSPPKPPHGVKFRISEDAGRTWPDSAERDIDVSSMSIDCGTARGLQLDDGSISIVYYMHRPNSVRAIMGAQFNF